MQRICVPLLISQIGNMFLVVIVVLVAGFLLPAFGIVIGSGVIAVIVNAFIGACGMFFQLLTTMLGIAGAVFTSLVGQLIGWYLDQNSGVIAATLGAMVLLLTWRRLVAAQAILDTTNLSAPSGGALGTGCGHLGNKSANLAM
jgi:uncharacterized membrane protein YeaQ/YmgE (transglycosylase-associated protein family)